MAGLPYGLQSMLKAGHQHFSGLEEAVMKNIDACKALSQITRTSLGPNGEVYCTVVSGFLDWWGFTLSRSCIERHEMLSLIIHTAPPGMNKMVINHLEKLFVTSDASTIVSELEVQHPAAKLLVMAAQAQEHEIGDGTNLVSQSMTNLRVATVSFAEQDHCRCQCCLDLLCPGRVCAPTSLLVAR